MDDELFPEGSKANEEIYGIAHYAAERVVEDFADTFAQNYLSKKVLTSFFHKVIEPLQQRIEELEQAVEDLS